MPYNINSAVTELLSWHGHDSGGVSVPFQSLGSPLGSTFQTPLIARLRDLSLQLAEGNMAAPRWVFLVGGPGNGKSETVQDFLTHLDLGLALDGALLDALGQAFTPNPIVRRRVEIRPDQLAHSQDLFGSRIGRLIVVQDATASDDAFGDAAQQLADDLTDLVTSDELQRPVIVVCANRGLLARAVNAASSQWGPGNEITQLLEKILTATSLGIEALSVNRPSCWPIDSELPVACWPMDLETLFSANDEVDPLDTMFQLSLAESKWEVAERCGDCDARASCPFRQNAEWLRDAGRVSGLKTLLRRGELATGQRWNFRGLFSLVAEICVGEWADFRDAHSPCEWVHSRVRQLEADDPSKAVPACIELVRRIYPHALFPAPVVSELAEYCAADGTISWSGEKLSRAIVTTVASLPSTSTTQIRQDLDGEFSRLDPAASTPADCGDLLNECELAFSQSVQLGCTYSRCQDLSQLEMRLLELLAEAENEWNLHGKNVRQATAVRSLLRKLGGVIVKRSAAVKFGRHAQEETLCEYELALRDQQRLHAVRDALLPLLGRENNFRFNLIESYGQPASDDSALLILECDSPRVRVFSAPHPSDQKPSHDVPWFEIRDIDYPVPITYEFFRALVLRRSGCASSSLPASVRAAIDRVRHLYAGRVCRDGERFADGSARIRIANRELSVVSPCTAPQLL